MNLFVSKIYTVAHYGFKRLDEEATFNTYEKALEFLKKEFFEDEYNEDFLKSYFAQIIEYKLVDGEISTKKTRYDCMGKVFSVIENTDIEEPKPKPINKNFVPQFANGDLVIIKYLAGTSFGLFAETIGVVTGVPSGYNEWKKRYNLPDEHWSTNYMVEFVGDIGFLTHCHPLEQEMELYKQPIPHKLIVLNKLAAHFKKEKLIDETILQLLRQGAIYALNYKSVNNVNWD